MATGINLPKQTKLSFCEGCVAGKMKRAPFKPVGEIRSERKLQIVHSDVCGPMPTDSIGGNNYFVTFINDYSRCCAVYFLKSKSEVPDKFKEFEAVCSVTVVYVLEYFVAIMEENIPIKGVQELSEFNGHTPKTHSAILSSTEWCC